MSMFVVSAVGGAEVVGMVVGWIASIALTGWMAHKKGRSVVGWALLAALFTLWAFVAVVLLASKKTEAAQLSEPDRLAELSDLHDAGVLTDEEFEEKQTKVLTGM